VNFIYLIIHGDKTKTGKLSLIDAKMEKNSSDLFFYLNALEVGKVDGFILDEIKYIWLNLQFFLCCLKDK